MGIYSDKEKMKERDLKEPHYSEGYVAGVFAAIDIIKGDTSYSHAVLVDEAFDLLDPKYRYIYHGTQPDVHQAKDGS